jgi:MoaA/NifB/PqqE/SkfB family radical SAM enzyme
MSMVVTHDSRAELEEAVRLANELGVAEFHFILPQPTPETAIDGSDLSPDEWNEVSTEVRSFAAWSPVPIGLDYGTYEPHPRPRCGTMAQRQIYIDARGQVPFCCQLSRYGTGPEPILGDLTREALATVMTRAAAAYDEFTEESTRLYQIGQLDEFDAYPCMSCARRHGQTDFLADFPEHPWAGLARVPA